MEHGDLAFLTEMIDAGHVHGTVLELGAYAWQGADGNTEKLFRGRGFDWTGSDIEAGPGVDVVLDILDTEATTAVGRTWDSVLVANLLEHVYDPGLALANALTLTALGGSVVVVGPSIWELHDYPADYWRPMPDFFIEFAKRNACTIPTDGFRWVLGSSHMPGAPLLDVWTSVNTLDPKQKIVPSRRHAEQVYGERRWLRSRIVHKLFDTAGREWWFPRAALGVVLRRDA